LLNWRRVSELESSLNTISGFKVQNLKSIDLCLVLVAGLVVKFNGHQEDGVFASFDKPGHPSFHVFKVGLVYNGTSEDHNFKGHEITKGAIVATTVHKLVEENHIDLERMFLLVKNSE
jgi:hypothetical protein